VFSFSGMCVCVCVCTCVCVPVSVCACTCVRLCECIQPRHGVLLRDNVPLARQFGGHDFFLLLTCSPSQDSASGRNPYSFASAVGHMPSTPELCTHLKVTVTF
jgi:hypothetical protein